MFTPIDLAIWPRAQQYYYFARMAPTAYSLTTSLDVTNLLNMAHEHGFKFFPAYLWLVTKNLNKHTEFKCALRDETLGYYDTLTPLYATWHDDDKTFSLMWTEFDGSFATFHANYLRNQEEFGQNHGLLCQPGTPPENAYTVSALPWATFSHFAVHNFENTQYYFPSVEAGKYEKRGDRVIMPLSLTCHHATTDGYHVSLFLEDLQRDANAFAQLI